MTARGCLPLPDRRDGDVVVHGIGWFDGPFGYNVHARGFFSALARHAPTAISRLFNLDGPFQEDRRVLRGLRADRDIVTVALMYGNLARDVLREAPGPRVIYTVWESTRLPDDWLPSLLAVDEVWTASRWGAAVMARNGVDPARLHVVPEGVDPELFNPEVPPTDAITRQNRYTFLHIGRFEDRKGTATLIRAFDVEFGAHDDVILVLACHNPHQPGFDIAAELRSLDLRHPEKLVFIPPVARHDVLAGLYTACDAFVAPSRAEGWGLPIIEAMACGLPVITTGHSAPLDYLGPESYRISGAMTPIETPYFDSVDGDHGMWAEPETRDLRRGMRRFYEAPDIARAAGATAGRRIRSNFTWDRAARRAIRALNALERLGDH
jgi:glycosyltransferase involved in cell wall biosynthesis